MRLYVKSGENGKAPDPDQGCPLAQLIPQDYPELINEKDTQKRETKLHKESIVK